MKEKLKKFGRFDRDGMRADTVEASYMVSDGFMVKLYRNVEGKATEDELVAIINTATGFSVIDVETKV